MNNTKRWGPREFWGVGTDYDPQWLLSDEQKKIQTDLIELCRTTLRPNAVHSDETYTYPRANLNALASQGLLGLIVPKELGGKGQSHQCAAMVVETIARYGCPSTAMVYVMHLGACSVLLFRHHHNETLKDILRRLDKDKLVGTEAYSDPATGGHFWYPMSSKCWKMADGSYRAVKYGSWATSAGFADWYAVQVVSPGYDGDYSNLSDFLFLKDEIRASTDEWSALGMHGNQSGPLVAECLLTPDRLIGPIGDGARSNDEIVDPFFLLISSCCWNGISLACIDVAKKHVLNKGHADVGLRVCDYPTIQDYFGETMTSTNASRLMAFSLAGACDLATNNCDWSIHEDLEHCPRIPYLHWFWQLKFESAKNVQKVGDVMLQACGGSGYKTDLGLERLIRDGKAGWVMGPSNEVLRQFVGKTVLMGFDIVDYWSQKIDERNLNSELKKLNTDQKSDLVQRLLYELKTEKNSRQNNNSFPGELYFDEPFSGKPPGGPGDIKQAGLRPDIVTVSTLSKVESLTTDGKIVKMTFDLPSKNSPLGTFPGQHIEIRVPANGSTVGRYMSPISDPNAKGQLEVAVRYENQGYLARFLESLKTGDKVSFRGPCGGLEYKANVLDHVVFICGGIGVTPAIQVLRAVINNKSDQTKITLLYQSKDRESLLFKEELDENAKDARVTVVCTLQDPDGEWTGHIGNIGQTFLKEYLPNKLEGKQKIVVCGGTPLSMSCLDALYRLQYNSEDIFIYGPFGAEMIKSTFGRGTKLTTTQLETSA